MPAISSLTRQRPTNARVDFGDDVIVNLVFDRNAITPAWANEANRRMNEDSDALALAKAFAEILLTWDITNDDGTPYPLTAENLARLPIMGFRDMREAIMEASVPSSEEGNASSDTSPSVSTDSSVMPVNLPNGQPTSPSPAPSASPSPT